MIQVKFRVRPTAHWLRGYGKSKKGVPEIGTAHQHSREPDCLVVIWDGRVTPIVINKKFIERVAGD